MDDNSPDNKASLPRDWRLWVAENALRKCDKPSMFQTMVNAGVAKDIAQQGIEDVILSAIQAINATSKLPINTPQLC